MPVSPTISYFRHLDIVPLSVREGQSVPARCYNRARVGILRLGEEIRLPVPELKHMDLILQRDAWIVVDRVLNDMPVVAWMCFQAARRGHLQEPVQCQVRTWHALAGMITGRTLQAMEPLLSAELVGPASGQRSCRVLRLPGGGAVRR